jgi:uncharacterized protein
MASIEAEQLPIVRKTQIDWTPYWTGAGIGILSWAAFALANDPLGITTALSAVAAYAARHLFVRQWKGPAMTLPVIGAALLPLGVLFGFIFGWLLQRARLTDTEVIIGQLRLTDYTLVKMMLTAIIVGGVGVFFLHAGGLAAYHVKPANLLAVALGAVLFGAGMTIYGYCPGTGIAAAATGSLHALVGAAGMLAGAVAFAFSFDWIKAKILPIAAYGTVRLPELAGIPDLVLFSGLALVAVLVLRTAARRYPF